MGTFRSFGLNAGYNPICIFQDPLNNLNTLTAGAFLVSTFGAMQDAAGDEMEVDVVPADQQARANGCLQGSKMVDSS